ncbi:hypothetical protein B0H13DRAFT_2371827 [Mycena leptocephala]|nr:hypothetical protein B0H13DRAFT_2371827 [Mycena leptocephala]
MSKRKKAEEPLRIPCPLTYCDKHLSGSAVDVAAHIMDSHAAVYHLTWEDVEGAHGVMDVIRKNGVVSHALSISQVLPVNMPTFPWPPITAQDWLHWTKDPRQPSTADLPPSQTQNPGARSHNEGSQLRGDRRVPESGNGIGSSQPREPNKPGPSQRNQPPALPSQPRISQRTTGSLPSADLTPLAQRTSKPRMSQHSRETPSPTREVSPPPGSRNLPSSRDVEMTASPLPTHDSSLGPSGGLKRRRSPSPSGATAKKPKLSPLSSLFSRLLGSFSSPVKGGAKSDSPSSPTPPPPPPSNPRRPLLAESSNLKSSADVEMPASSQFRLPQKHQGRESLSQLGGAKSDSPSSPTPSPPPPSNPRRPLLAESSNLKSPADVEMPASSQFRLPQKHQGRESLSQLGGAKSDSPSSPTPSPPPPSNPRRPLLAESSNLKSPADVEMPASSQRSEIGLSIISYPSPPPPSNPRRPLLAESSNLKSPADVEMPASSQFRLPQKHQARESLSQPRLSQPRLSQRTRDSLLSADFAEITPTKAIYPRFSQRNPDSLPVADFTEISPQKSTQTRLSQRGLKPLPAPTARLMDLLKVNQFEVNIKERIAICMACQFGYLVDAAVDHAHKTHELPSRPPKERAEFKSGLIAMGLAQKPRDLRHRAFGEAPIEGIKVSDGAACAQCEKAWSTPDRHRWVRVNLGNTGPGDATDAYSLYEKSFGAEFDKPPSVRPGPVNSNAICLLAKITNWPQHLRARIRNETDSEMTEADVTGLMSLVDTSAISRHPHYRLLAEVIKTYHDQAVVIYQRTDHHVRYLLMECPRANETKLFNIPSSEAISRYLQTWIRFTFALLISPDSEKTPYRFPFTEFEKKAVREMQTCFHATPPPSGPERVTFMANLASAFHSFIRTFLLIREAPLNPPPPNPAKFDSILECLQAVSAIRPGGILCRPHDLTSTCTHLKYWIRLCLLYEADQRVHTRPGLTLQEAVYELGMKNLNPLTVSEFTRVAENSSLFTSLINDSVHAPVMRVSADYNDFTYLGTTLHLPKLRHTVQSAVLELKKRLDDLMMGIDVPVEYPKIWTDVWTNEEAGYSFLKSNTFFQERRPWIRRLLQSKTVGLASRNLDGSVRRDANGNILLNSHVTQDILAKDRDFLNLAMPLSYVTTGLRGEEFAEIRLENWDRPRGFFVDQNGDCWFASGRTKPESITRKTTFIPSLIPQEISDLLLKYIIVVRPGITELVRLQHMADDKGVAAFRQSEFLWVSDGEVFDGKKLGGLLEEFSQFCCSGGKAGLRPLRHIFTEIMRVYFGTKRSDAEDDGVDIHSARMGHSLRTARTHYGIDGTKTMTSDRLLEYRDASLDVHQALGLGPAGKMPLIPLRLRSGARFLPVSNPQPPALPSTQGFSMEQLSTVFAAALREHEVRMEKKMEETCIRAYSKAYVSMGQHRISHHSPPAPPPAELAQMPVPAQAQGQPLASPFRSDAPSRREPRSASAQNRYAPYSNPSDIPPASSARAAPGPHVSPTGFAINLQADVRGAMADNLVSKLQALADLSTRLKGHCAACWALHGRFNIANHLPFLTCSTGRSLPTDVNSPGYDGPGFKAKFEDYTACWGCWLPQLNGTVNKHLYTRTNHPVPGKGRCTHPFAFKEIAWVVFKTPDLWAKFLNSSNFPVPPHVTVEKYATWLTRQDKGMVNVGNVAYWLLRHYGLST